jgi:TP901 family phage tail tape measure protein
LVSAQAKAQIAVRELNEANRASKGTNEEVTESLVRAKAELSSLRTSTTKAQKAIDQTKASMKQYGVDLNDVQANQKRYREESDRLAAELTDLSLVQTKLVAKARQQAGVQIELSQSSKTTAAAVERYREELAKLVAQYRKGALSAEQFEASEKAVRQELSLSSAQVTKTRQSLKGYSDQLKTVPSDHSKSTSATSVLTGAIKGLGAAYLALEAAQKAAQGAQYSYQQYTEVENALLGVKKTTSLTATEIEALSEEMRTLSGTVTPTTRAELLGIAEAAGRMGIEGSKNLSAFVKSVDALSATTDLMGENAATAIARILEVTGEAQSNVTGVASAINALGNSVAATESEIVHFAQRLASDTGTMKLASSEVLGLAAGMAQMGIQAEGASSVIGRTFRKIEDSVQNGGNSMAELARLTGLTEDAVKQAFGSDKVGLFGKFVEGINRAQKSGETLNSILEGMGLKSDENARILGLLSQKWGNMSEIINTSNTAFKEGNGHFVEMSAQAAGLETTFQRLTNRAAALAEIVGEAFSDDLNQAMNATLQQSDKVDDAFGELGEILAEVVQQALAITETIAGTMTAINEVTGVVSIFNGVLNTAAVLFDGLLEGVNFLTGGLAQLAIVWNRFWGDTEDVKEWTKIQEDAFKRAEEAQERYRNRIERMEGDASRAYQDLRDAYNENRDALASMDAEQSNAIQTIIESTGYLEGNDQVYRDLTRSIQRAAAEKVIVAGYTKEENTEYKKQVALLKATGKSQQEAEQQARLLVDAKIEQTKAEKANAKAQAEAAESAEKNNESSTKSIELAHEELEALASLSDAQFKYKNELIQAQKAVNDKTNALSKATHGTADYELALFDLVKAQKDLAQASQIAGSETLKSFDKVANAATSTSQQVKDAFIDGLGTSTTQEEITELVGQFTALGESGKVSASDIASGLESVQQALTEVATGARVASGAFNGLSLSSAGISSYLASLDKARSSQQSKTNATKADTSATEQNTEALKENGGAAAYAAEKADSLVGYTYKLAGLSRAEWHSLSDEMGQAFDSFVDYTQGYQKLLSERGIATASAWVARMSRAYATVADQAQRLQSQYENQNRAADRWIEKLSDTNGATEQMAAQAERAMSSYKLLGSEKLTALRSAIASIRAETESLNQSLSATLSSLKDELDSLNNNQLSIETRAYQTRLASLQEQLEQARSLGNNEAINNAKEAIQLLRETYQLKKASIQSSDSGTSASTSDTTSTGGTVAKEVYTVNVTIAGQSRTINAADQASAKDLVAMLDDIAAVSPN